jgi:hypothetical protein
MYVLASTRFCNIYAIYSSKLKRFVAVTLRVVKGPRRQEAIDAVMQHQEFAEGLGFRV